MRTLSIISILILFSALFVFSGCVTQEVKEKVVTGINGLEISFESGMPPTSIDEGEPFDIGVLMENKGTASVNAKNAAVYISGILYDSYDGITSSTAKQTNKIKLEGAYIEGGQSITGDSDVLTWTGLKYKPDITAGKYTTTMTAQSCYRYETNARAPICLATRSAIRDVTGTPICQINGEKTVTNDAAPVQVSKITEYTYGSDGFKAVIEIQNVGDGLVYDISQSTNCQGLARQHMNKVYIADIKLGSTAFADTECNWITEDKKHYVKLVDGVKTLTCRKTGLAGSGISQENLNINLIYGYSKTIQTSMDINAIV